MMREVVEKTIDIYLYMKVDKRSARMRSDSDRNMSASLTRITRQVSRLLDLNFHLYLPAFDLFHFLACKYVH